MSVNIYDGTNLTPIAGKTVPAPTPDYVDEQFNSSKTYSKGMTCIEGNVRYRYKNSTATSGHRPPDTTYWEVFSVSDELSAVKAKNTENVLWSTGVLTSSDFSAYADGRRLATLSQTLQNVNAVFNGAETYGRDNICLVVTRLNPNESTAPIGKYKCPLYIPGTLNRSDGAPWSITGSVYIGDPITRFDFPMGNNGSTGIIYFMMYGGQSGVDYYVNGFNWILQIIAYS